MSSRSSGWSRSAARRARNINSYFNQLGDGLGHMVPPQVSSVARKPLSIGFEEIAADKIEWTEVQHPEPAEDAAVDGDRDARRARRRLTDRRQPRHQHPTTKDDDVPLDLHLRERHRRPSRQDGRPGQRRGARRDPRRGPQRSCRLRDAAHHRAVRRRRRDHHRRPTSTSPSSPARRSTTIGYDNALYGFDGNTCGVIVSIDEQSPEHRPGRRHQSEEVRGGTGRRGPAQRAGRRRPGDDVRLRLRRDARPDAAADLDRPPPGRAPGRGAQVRPGAVPAPRRQDPGHVRVRRRHAGRAEDAC